VTKRRTPRPQGNAVRWVALLRAINVGGHTVKMDRLRALFEELGFTGVSTFIASGNVLFEADADEARHVERIERHLRTSLGFEVGTFLRTAAELEAISRLEPFPAHPETGRISRYVAFLGAPPPAATRRRIEALSNEIDQLRVHGRDIHWLCHGTSMDSTVSGAVLEKTAGTSSTVRNLNTVGRLVKKLSA